MKLAVISFTEHGSRLNAGLLEMLSRQGYDCEGYAGGRYAKKYGLLETAGSLREWTKAMFAEKDGIVFIGAAGIAVRSIAPFLEHKSKDPAVVVMDEKGVFAISLLSGHLGGANELAGVLANLTGAIPVITTATDVNGRFAVDIFAKRNGLLITDMTCAKKISADVLDEKPVGFQSDFPVTGRIPQEIELWDSRKIFEGDSGICVTLEEGRRLYRQTLVLLPKIVSLGIGCKKDMPFEQIEKRVMEVLKRCGVSVRCVERIASIDLKAQEPGILAFAKKYGIPYVTYPAEELAKAEGEFSESAFVESVAGVANVCERSAVLSAENGRLIQKKDAGGGVTAALAVRDWSVDFE
ncbi:MAG: cobalt-precorrin 5A hydrolase [Eubacteriales bacterium]|nr:cobalt-precorrin 5A hydrolase [Eubacteriales bacterium]